MAIHCKGGKGRTGTMICILLIELGLFEDAANSLEYFGQRRTDKNVSEKFQGVETASQVLPLYDILLEKLMINCSMVLYKSAIYSAAKTSAPLAPTCSRLYECLELEARIND